jgi:hypothetical protein
MRTHTIRTNQIAAGKYAVAGSRRLDSVDLHARQRRRARASRRRPSRVRPHRRQQRRLHVRPSDHRRDFEATPRSAEVQSEHSGVDLALTPFRACIPRAPITPPRRQKATKMTRITNPASPGRANPIDSQGWFGPPIAGARPVNIGGFHPALPNPHPVNPQHSPLTPHPAVAQHAPVNQRGAHH